MQLKQIKSMEIITTKSLNVVCRLGGFHTLMSFLGSIGTLMAGSGLSNVLETVYGKNGVEHMMTGKAITRAIRGHFLIDAALNMILLKELIPVMQDNQHDEIVSDNDDLILSRLWILYSDIVDKSYQWTK